MHGTPCFGGTRVAVQTLFDGLEAGHTIGQFLEQFSSIRSAGALAQCELVYLALP